MAQKKELPAEAKVTAWEMEPKTITLTNGQWSSLNIYILMTTQHRKNEREAWEKLAKDLAGEKVAETAASNAQFYADLEGELEAIRKAIGF